MPNLILGYFLYKYGRSLIATLIKLGLGLILVCLYGFYKLFQITVLAIQDSPFEMLLVGAFMGCLMYWTYGLKLKASSRSRKSKSYASVSRSTRKIAISRRGY
jgi:hypothetical protein